MCVCVCVCVCVYIYILTEIHYLVDFEKNQGGKERLNNYV